MLYVKIIVYHRRLKISRWLAIPRYAQSVGAKHYDTSAKLDKGVSDMMLDLTKREYSRKQNTPTQSASSIHRQS